MMMSDDEYRDSLVTHFARTHLARRHKELSISDQIDRPRERMMKAASQLQGLSDESQPHRGSREKKKRKIFNGIGKILSGGILGAGNVLLGTGGIVAPNPAIA